MHTYQQLEELAHEKKKLTNLHSSFAYLKEVQETISNS